MLSLQNLWRRIALAMRGSTLPYPGPAQAVVIPFPAKKQKPKPGRNEKRAMNG